MGMAERGSGLAEEAETMGVIVTVITVVVEAPAEIEGEGETYREIEVTIDIEIVGTEEREGAEAGVEAERPRPDTLLRIVHADLLLPLPLLLTLHASKQPQQPPTNRTKRTPFTA